MDKAFESWSGCVKCDEIKPSAPEAQKVPADLPKQMKAAAQAALEEMAASPRQKLLDVCCLQGIVDTIDHCSTIQCCKYRKQK
ncbi:hypothetical protein PAHAL_3G233300 [Panicum hallii]|uniref:Uncharacterized protein n=1 Tax=Panicum hallii TaxID=206008 RepID=A0A2S3HAX9_9POAL|nr:hypothetical protein PAHAL_3G233300 [Panicum hallii]